ncbi:MAG: MBL fold metallo-hydrolase [Cyclobacteriaceae bacterium]|nr:MAG: MBL fold metallo-hydrolase [Cyclobacteriaceae bacterium]
MKVEQFYDKALGHASYAILSEREVAIVDPGRDPKPYTDFAEKNGAVITSVFETHPHADFTSCHLELHKKLGAIIYISPKAGVSYPHQPLQHGDEVKIGSITLRALFTPGHSPDHNSYLLIDKNGVYHAVFTGDSLFVGDVGRPDLREGIGNIQMKREGLARMMYQTLKSVFEPMDDEVIVYPAHGAGSLCGKQMNQETFSTIGKEKQHNWAFQVDDESQFVNALLEDQPFIPKYFPSNVEMNRVGVPAFQKSINAVPRLNDVSELREEVLKIDSRPQLDFKSGHAEGAINIQQGEKFETWLGSIVGPEEQFYLIAQNTTDLDSIIAKAAKIGYEKNITGALIASSDHFSQQEQSLDLDHFKTHPEDYLVIDIRNHSEVKQDPIFDQSVNIPLHQLREQAHKISTEKPVVVHCAGGYRSAAGSSILSSLLPENKVYDLSDAVKEFSETINTNS